VDEVSPDFIVSPKIHLISASGWNEYELLDSGNGRKLERYGKYLLDRPEPEALWMKALPEKTWQNADAVYNLGNGLNSGSWQIKSQIPTQWYISYRNLKFLLQLSSSRHIGVFPEQAVQWDWISEKISHAQNPIKVLNLFGYTAIASLAAAQEGAKVTHVDASNKAILWAKQNQQAAHLSDAPIRWILDDALKFIQREVRRGSNYDGIILDPPKFGRGPKGEVWDFYKLFPQLMEICRQVLNPNPLFIVLTAYAVKASALTLYYSVDQMMSGYRGEVSAGETVLVEKSAGRMISTAMYVRWNAL